MSTTPPAPIVPPADDDDTAPVTGDETLLGDDSDQPLDPDLADDTVSSAEADQRAATEGERDGSVDEHH